MIYGAFPEPLPLRDRGWWERYKRHSVAPQTTLPQDTPVSLTGEFGNHPEKAAMWHAFLRRNDLKTTEATLSVVIYWS